MIFVVFLISLTLGAGIGFLLYRVYRTQIIRKAQTEADDILHETQQQLELRRLEEQEIIQDLETELWTRSEKDLLKLEEHIEELQDIFTEQKTKTDQTLEEKKHQFEKYQQKTVEFEKNVKQLEKLFHEKKQDVLRLKDTLSEKLAQKLSLSPKEIIKQQQEQWLTEARVEGQKIVERVEEETRENAEVKAKAILDIVLDRFARPYCPERGIGAVEFPSPAIREAFCKPEKRNIETVQEVCGCDLIIEDDMNMVGVAGFDPVRRELTRRTLEKIFRDIKLLEPQQIQRVAENQKKELFRQIRADGDAVAKELRLEGLHPEIRQMMGSLRYRYSFTQNQYFHCAEVGWLCGLLSAELNLNISSGRRAGLLHDIGKSMDHALDGGHAVIGADFIQARHEKTDIVHAVRAHHFDEQPNSDLAFLVIAADAISGARPGARRSTIESYNQKVTEMQDIARSFEGVTDVIILSGGRECRVTVNGRKIDDHKALTLSAQIAKKIETDCNYPGQIKVVVVRETIAVETTR